MTTLLLGEVANGHLADITTRALTAAKTLGAPVHVLLAGHNPGAAAETFISTRPRSAAWLYLNAPH